MKTPATLRAIKTEKEDWSGVNLGFKVIDGNVMPTMPDGKLLEDVISCSVSSSVEGFTVMTISVELKNG